MRVSFKDGGNGLCAESTHLLGEMVDVGEAVHVKDKGTVSYQLMGQP